MTFETAFTMDTSSIKYGPGVIREVGHDMKELGTRHVMIVTDPNLAKSQAVSVTIEVLGKAGIDALLFYRVSVEPTDSVPQSLFLFKWSR
jgi:hydroxyacid-oxoacid transhydrogenase